MFTLYRSKGPTGGFRAVAGAHDPLPQTHYTRHDFASSRDALGGCQTDDERKVVLMVDPLADARPGTWVRVDKGDGEVSEVTADRVFETCHTAKVFRTGAELRRRMAQAENGLRVTLETEFARFEYKQRAGDHVAAASDRMDDARDYHAMRKRAEHPEAPAALYWFPEHWNP